MRFRSVSKRSGAAPRWREPKTHFRVPEAKGLPHSGGIAHRQRLLTGCFVSSTLYKSCGGTLLEGKLDGLVTSNRERNYDAVEATVETLLVERHHHDRR